MFTANPRLHFLRADDKAAILISIGQRAPVTPGLTEFTANSLSPPQVLADAVSRLVVDKFSELTENFTSPHARRKVLAGVVMTTGISSSSFPFLLSPMQLFQWEDSHRCCLMRGGAACPVRTFDATAHPTSLPSSVGRDGGEGVLAGASPQRSQGEGGVKLWMGPNVEQHLPTLQRPSGESH